MNCKLLLIPFLCLFGNEIMAQNITFRFSSPIIDQCTELCYNVEAQTDAAGLLLDEFNMRMYIDDCQLVFDEFRNPANNYLLESGGETQTGIPGSGAIVFGFDGDFVYIIDNLKRSGQNATEIAIAPAWTYLFQCCFTSSFECQGVNTHPGFFINTPTGEACPSLVLDQDTDGSGFGIASDGIEALAVNPDGGPAFPLDESVIHTNWDYYDPNVNLGECVPACLIPLPDILDVAISSDDCSNIHLSWEVEAEESTNYYIIERRYKGESQWESIGKIVGKNQLSSYRYHFYDDNNTRSSGEIHYRVMHHDHDGSIEQAILTSHELQCEASATIKVYPNPFQQNTTLSFSVETKSTFVEGNVFDEAGRKVLSNVLSGTYENGYYEEPLDLSKLRSGHYMLQLQIGDQIKNVSFQKVE